MKVPVRGSVRGHLACSALALCPNEGDGTGEWYGEWYGGWYGWDGMGDGTGEWRVYSSLSPNGRCPTDLGHGALTTSQRREGGSRGRNALDPRHPARSELGAARERARGAVRAPRPAQLDRARPALPVPGRAVSRGRHPRVRQLRHPFFPFPVFCWRQLCIILGPFLDHFSPAGSQPRPSSTHAVLIRSAQCMCMVLIGCCVGLAIRCCYEISHGFRFWTEGESFNGLNVTAQTSFDDATMDHGTI